MSYVVPVERYSSLRAHPSPQPRFTIVAVLTLAIGIGANRDLQLRRCAPAQGAAIPGRRSHRPRHGEPPRGDRDGISTLDFLDWQRDDTVFDFMSRAVTGSRSRLTVGSEPVQLQRRAGLGGYFEVFGSAGAGPHVYSRSGQLGRRQVAVIGHNLGDIRSVRDQVHRQSPILSTTSRTVVGVLPEATPSPRTRADLAPLSFQPSNMTRDFHWLGVVRDASRGLARHARAGAGGDGPSIGARISNASYPCLDQGLGRRASIAPPTPSVGPELRQAALLVHVRGRGAGAC